MKIGKFIFVAAVLNCVLLRTRWCWRKFLNFCYFGNFYINFLGFSRFSIILLVLNYRFWCGVCGFFSRFRLIYLTLNFGAYETGSVLFMPAC